MDVQEGASGVSDLKCCRSLFELTDVKNIGNVQKNRVKGKNILEKKRGKMPNLTQLIDFCSVSLNFLIFGIFSKGFLGNICVGLSWPSVSKWTQTLLMKMLPYIHAQDYIRVDGTFKGWILR